MYEKPNLRFLSLISIFFIMAVTSISPAGDIIYVKQGGTGTSWADPYGQLQDALDAAAGDPNQIWVAAGTYYPTADYGLVIGDRGSHFRMINGVEIYGGFPATGNPVWEDRDPDMYDTILSGDENGGSNVDACHHVFYHPAGLALDATAILDGFSITAGNSNQEWPSPHSKGGGMYNYENHPTINNCTFTNNTASHGAGIWNEYSSPVLSNITFSNNSAFWYGSGMYNNEDSNPIVTNCIFNTNTAVAGGGMSNFFSDPTMINCTFRGNSVSQLGGGLCNGSSNPIIINCIFTGNTAYEGGGIYNFWSCLVDITNCTFSGNQASYGNTLACINWQQGGDPSTVQISNSIFWDGPNEIWNNDSSSIAITYSCIQGGWGGAGSNNIDADPQFVDADGDDDIAGTEDDDLNLSANSPCIDAGDSLAAGDILVDAAGNPRGVDNPSTPDTGNAVFGGAIVDMGAYEFQPGVDPCETADKADFDCSGIVDLADFAYFASKWLSGSL